jgi:hypothetical protein
VISCKDKSKREEKRIKNQEKRTKTKKGIQKKLEAKRSETVDKPIFCGLCG